MVDDGSLGVDKDGGLHRFRLRRPPVNALDNDLVARLSGALADAVGDPDCRAVLIVSDIPGVFCAGADIRFLQSAKGADLARFQLGVRACFSDIEAAPLPVIAAVGGTALGGGFELMLACDFALVGDNDATRLGLPEVKLGVLPGAGGTQRLARTVGKPIASHLIMTGGVITPRRAYELHLAAELVDPATLSARAEALAAELASGPLTAYQAAKRALREATLDGIEQGLDVELHEAASLLDTADAREGLAAFTERRPPRYTGK